MIVKQGNKFIGFIKKFWGYILAGFLVVSIGVTLGVVAAVSDDQGVVDVVKPSEDENKTPEDDNTNTPNPDENPDNGNSGEEGNNNQENQNPPEDEKPVVNPEVITFAMPMNNATIIKDFTDLKLEYNPTLDRWEAHKYMDITSEDLSVMSVLDGKVLSVEYDYLTGYVIQIEHDDGFISSYASLSEDVKVKVGDSVQRGQVIGSASSLAASSSSYGDHLEFMLMKNNKKIDPNNYLDFQQK